MTIEIVRGLINRLRSAPVSVHKRFLSAADMVGHDVPFADVSPDDAREAASLIETFVVTSTTGATLIAAERQRQVAQEGWTSRHDDEHVNGEIRDAAIAYAMVCDDRAGEGARDVWPWSTESWRPSDDPIRNLVRAGALIAAEIDRLRRASGDRDAQGEALSLTERRAAAILLRHLDDWATHVRGCHADTCGTCDAAFNLVVRAHSVWSRSKIDGVIGNDRTRSVLDAHLDDLARALEARG